MIAALLLAQAVVGPPAPPAEVHEQKIFLIWEAREKACVPRVNGVDTGDVTTPAGEAAFLAALPDKGMTLRVLGKAGTDAPFDCAMRVSDALRHAGFYGRILYGLPETRPTPAAP